MLPQLNNCLKQFWTGRNARILLYLGADAAVVAAAVVLASFQILAGLLLTCGYPPFFTKKGGVGGISCN